MAARRPARACWDCSSWRRRCTSCDTSSAIDRPGRGSRCRGSSTGARAAGPKETSMESFNVMVDAAREFLHQAAAFMPRLALALLIVAFGWLIARAVRFGVERGLRAVKFNILTE